MDDSSALQAAWTSPAGNAIQAAANVTQAAAAAGAFKLPPALASIVNGLAPKEPSSVAGRGSPVQNTSVQTPAPRRGFLAWVMDHRLLSAGIAAAAVLAIILLRRKG